MPLQRLIINNRNIKILKLNNNGLGIEGARLIAEALEKAHFINVGLGVKDTLQVVVFGRNRMESPGVTFLAKALALYKDSLIHIQMPQNSIRPDGIVILMESIKQLFFISNPPVVTSLNFWICKTILLLYLEVKL